MKRALPPLVPITPDVMPEGTELHESVTIKEEMSEDNCDPKVDPVDIEEESNEDMAEENFDPKEDPSVAIDPGASRSELIDGLKLNGNQDAIKEYLTDEKLRERLEETLRCKHPIQKIIARLDLEDVKALICYAGHYSKVYGTKSYRGKREDIIYPKILSKVIFEAKPEAPISYLTKIQNIYRNNGPKGHRKVLKQFRAQYLKNGGNLPTDSTIDYRFENLVKKSEDLNQKNDVKIATLVERPNYNKHQAWIKTKTSEKTEPYNVYGKSSSGKTCNMCLQTYHPKSYSRHVKYCVRNLAAELDPAEQPKTYTWRGKSISGRTCNKCLQSVHPASYYGHIRKCNGIKNKPLENQIQNQIQLMPINNIEKPKQNIDIKMEVQEAKGDSEYVENEPSKKKRKLENKIQLITSNNIEEPKQNIDMEVQKAKETLEYIANQPLKKKPKIEAQKICDVCQKPFKTYHALLVHRLEVHGIKINFPCDLCDFIAYLPKALRMHKAEQHSSREKPGKPTILWKCHQCDIKFSSLKRLENHKKIHPKETKVVEVKLKFKQSDQVTSALLNPSVNSDSIVVDRLDLNNEESDPLGLNNEEPSEPKLVQPNDPSVLVDPEASREWMIIELKLHCQVPEELEDLDNLPKEKLQEKLEETLKCKHPIHKVIAGMSVEEMQALTCYSGDPSKVFGEANKRIGPRYWKHWREILAISIFKAKPESPLSYLKELHNGYKITGPIENKKVMKIFEANVKQEEELSKKYQNQINDILMEEDECLKKVVKVVLDRSVVDNYIKFKKESESDVESIYIEEESEESVKNVIAKLSTEEIQALLCYAGDHTKVFGRWRYHGNDWDALLVQNIFKTKPESPLTYLTQLQSEYKKSLLEHGHQKTMEKWRNITYNKTYVRKKEAQKLAYPMLKKDVPIDVQIAKWCSRNIR